MRAVAGRRQVCGLLAAAVLASTLAACAQQPPTEHALLGSYRDGSAHTVLRIQAGGACVADDLETVQGPVTGSCRWRVPTGQGGFGAAAPTVTLDFSGSPQNHVGQVEFTVQDGGRKLSYTDDSDDITVSVQRA